MKFSFASDENIKIEDYSYKDGLTASGVTNVYKDSKGFLWLCSNNGLFRFDGYTFRNINTLVENNLNLETYCITEDSDNNFLIGSVNDIIYYDTHIEKLFPLKLNLDNNCRIRQILLFQGKIWAASNIGLIIIDLPVKFNPTNTLQVKILLPDSMHRRTPQDNVVNTMFYEPGNQSLWVGTNGALYELNLKTLTFQYINSFSQNSIRGISMYNHNLMVSSWDGGIFLVDPSRHKLENNSYIREVNKIIGDKRVMSALVDDQNHMWVATFGNGLYIFEKSKSGSISFENYRNNQKQQENLKSDFIQKMYLDTNGIVWLCMNQPALSKVYFQKSNLKYFSFPGQKSNHDFKEMLSVNQSTDKNKLWVATNGSGIYLFDTKSHTFKQYSVNSTTGLRLQNNEVTLCYQDKTGNLWIVYRRIGLYVVPSKVTMNLLEGNLKTCVKPIDANSLLTQNPGLNSYITTFYEDSDGRLWIGLWGSLYIVELDQGSSTIYNTESLLSEIKTTCIFNDERREEINFPTSPVLSILELNKNRYWLGTLREGIIQLDEISKNSFSGKKLAMNNRLPTNNIKCFYMDKSKNIWIGTNSGLCYWNIKTDSLKIITSSNGLASENINNVIEDDNSNCWVSTSYGISEIKSNVLSVQNYFYSDRENYNQYIPNAVAHTPDGLVWFSTNEALVMINPDSIKNSGQNPPLYFTDIKIDNKTIVPLEKYHGAIVINANINECRTINVPYNHTLSIEFAGLDFKNPDRLLYRYRIGDNNEWILLTSNQRSLSIPNLKHGEYSLNVMLANTQDVKRIRSIKIKYLPPFWLTKTAYFVYFLFVMILLFIYRRLLIQRILQKSILEKERFERKKIEELDKMKSEFFSNISHEFRTPLSLIINPLEKIIKEEEISIKNIEKIKLVLKSSNRLLKLTNELMDFSKIEKKILKPDFRLCEIVTFTNEICQLFDNLADSMHFDFKTNCSFEHMEIPIDKEMIEKVLFNLLSNAFKYTPENGMIMVNITKSREEEKEYIKLSVINTGEGIANETLSSVFDRYYQVNNIQNRNIEGTGLGLAIVKSFVELHNGKIDVKSEPNLETCFDIYLPVIQDNFNITNTLNEVTSVKPLKDVTLNQENNSHISGTSFHYRLLVIEDEEDIRNYLIEELSSEFNVITAKDGEEGLKIATNLIPDVIITDVIMPVLTGLELCERLKNQVITSHIPVLILSAKASVENQIEGLEMGADVYMVKPFNIDHLKAQLLRLISFKEAIYSRYKNETSLIPQDTLSNKLDENFMQKVMTFIEKNITDTNLSVDQLANCVSLSRVQTYRKIKAISGLSIVEFIRTIRLKKAAQMVMEGLLSISEIAFETGFSTPSYFSKCFHDHFGKTPSEFASGYKKTV